MKHYESENEYAKEQLKKAIDTFFEKPPILLTDEDRLEIASLIKVPIVEKIVEKKEIRVEVPVVKEVAIIESIDNLFQRINNAPFKFQIDATRISNLPDLPDPVDQIILNDELPKYGITFRDALEKLRGNDRLDASAIKGLEDYATKKDLELLTESHRSRTVFAGASALSRMIDVDLTGLIVGNTIVWNGSYWVPGTAASTGVTTIGIQGDSIQLSGAVTVSAGSGMLIQRTGQNLRFSSVSSPGTFSEMIATGARDTTNKDFTFVSVPTVIIVNGFTLHLSVTSNNYSFTWNAGTLTATIPQPVGSNGVIYGLGTQ